MKKWIAGMMIVVFALAAGCSAPASTMQQQTDDKVKTAENLMRKVPTPELHDSLERKNIRQRLIVTNDESQVGWVYLLGGDSTIISRLAARGKVTSGGKRLTDDQTLQVINQTYQWINAPDEMGAYGSSNPYIFFFTPNGMLVQWSGDYLYTSEPYMVNPKTKQIEYSVDAEEMAKLGAYKDQIAKTPLEKAKGGQ